MLIPRRLNCAAGIESISHSQFPCLARSAILGGRKREEFPMSVQPQMPSPGPRRRRFAMPATGGLRPDLAAFFVAMPREFTPRRIAAEHGILAELRAISGSD
jgi:hypothetical protein